MLSIICNIYKYRIIVLKNTVMTIVLFKPLILFKLDSFLPTVSLRMRVCVKNATAKSLQQLIFDYLLNESNEYRTYRTRFFSNCLIEISSIDLINLRVCLC